MKILSIDTTTYTLGVGVSAEGEIKGEVITNLKKNHSIRLMPAIDYLLKEASIKTNELDRIAVAKGPGSYTGVRIGVTTAKSMAWALHIPVVGVSSLKILAQNGKHFQGVVCPFIDARREQVYTGLYQGSHGECRMVEKDRITLMEDWLQGLKKIEKDVLFLSQDIEKHRELIEYTLGDKALFGTMQENSVRPGELLALGEKAEPGQSVHEFVPEYIQLAEAEKKWLADQKGKSNG
ncbi:tRNA (adenosine(37)-N6)-threonylcarbamoyltransferase complex dimerization subunit type 1 TsaB [Bacillus sp. FJAT-44742]|uniref:tRNA (adenosine(37)-N6)-threonylcarbamoyltransferase complex dimerization subunit type 1 TsaB n=1 Tax=Bacillus sp. FJAT-44742 TaxID=2014005 RepID=UPI000C238337|nr:tRNA (adenosine(37)-N6)-threonylcarbamoyltransferase complex dimerization subunit type 1 TsaB [Bacillus sp. FJAT-44742]